MRAQTRYPFQDVVDESVTQTRQSLTNSGILRAPAPTVPPKSFTTAATDSEGNVFTQYPALTELDSTNSGAVTS